MSFTKKLTSVVLSICMVISVLTVAIVPAAAEETQYETYAQDTVQGSNILHCFNWSYNNIKSALPDIAAAGYTAVQTSPVQRPKDYNSSWTDTPNQWWKLYQPLGFSIAANDTSWLGTKSELTMLCTEADKYGIKVVVDIVANHLANNGTDGGTYDYLNSAVESELKNSAYYHTNNIGINDNNRYTITQYHMGMPDLNTANSYVQQRALGLLEECIDCGVDGFRFDAAKHIELPSDPNNCKSEFWPTVINGAKSYATAKGVAEPFFYGEILGGAGTNISNYTTYMAVTDNQTGDRALDKAYWNAASELADSSYMKGASADKSVLWVESHDTYMGNSGSAYFSNTKDVTSDVIKRTWAIVGARADSTALYFARPNNTMGAASTDITWRSKQIVEINKFKNHFVGQSEYLASSGNTAYIERGTKGVVISKLDGGGTVNLNANRMASGTYTDQVSGNTFTVANGIISGTVGSTGVAVVYNTDDEVYNTITASKLYLMPYSGWDDGSSRFAMYVFNSHTNTNAWVSMTSEGNGYYSANVPAGKWTNVIFCQMKNSSPENNWNNKTAQTINLYPDDGTNCYTVTDHPEGQNYTGTWSVYDPDATEPVVTPTEQPTETPANTYKIYAIDNAGWDAENMKIHYWGDGDTTWPGNYMQSFSGTKVYSYDVPKNVSGIIFNIGSGKQTVDITSGISDGAVFIINNTQENGKYTFTLAPTYYLVGSMNGWSNNNDYAFSIIQSDSGKVEYKLSGVHLDANVSIKVHDRNDAWYPDGTGNDYSVAASGTYDVYFRPNQDGANDWHSKYFYLYKYNTVTWENADGTVLETDSVTDGAVPAYNGELPAKEPTVDKTYTFTGWKKSGDEILYTDNFPAVTSDVTYTAQFSESPRTYTIKWMNGDQVLETDQTVYGATPEYNGAIPVSLDDPGLVFSTWAPQITAVTGDQTYTARFSYNTQSYTITWLDGDGNTLLTDTVLEGVMPSYHGTTPTRSADAQYTYTFNGTWSPDLVAAAGNATYIANFDTTVNKYTVTFKNDDGTVLESKEYNYGDMPIYSQGIPEKASTLNYSYQFIGWNPAINSVTGNAEYTANYTENPVSTKFINVTNVAGWDKVYVYYWLGGENNTWPGKEMYMSDDKFICHAEIPVTATNIIFTNGEGKQTVDIDLGECTNWAILNEKDETDTTKYAVHEVPTYYALGTFNNWSTQNTPVFGPVKNDDKIEEYKLPGIQLNEGDELKVYGDNNTWYPDGVDNNYIVPADGTYDIYFRPNGDGENDWHGGYFYAVNVTTYTVTWLNDNDNFIYSEQYTYGDTPVYKGNYEPSKPEDYQYTYTFTGWSPVITPVTGDVTYRAVFDRQLRKYTITWLDDDDTVLATTSEEFGTIPHYPNADPEKEADAEYTYTFVGWLPDVNPVSGEFTYRAVYDRTVNTYTVRWLNDDNSVLKSETYPYGAMPYYGVNNPEKQATVENEYIFLRWSPEVNPVTGNADYTAVYDELPRMYNVRWLYPDGSEINNSFWAYGSNPIFYGTTPSIPSTAEYHYDFTGWSPDPQFAPVTGDMEYTAQFDAVKNVYPVNWFDYDGRLLTTTFVEYGQIPVYPDVEPSRPADAQYTYTFSGWDPVVTAVEGEMTYRAQYDQTLNQYTINWYGRDNHLLYSEQLYYGEYPSYSGVVIENYSDENYHYYFSGWDPYTHMVTGDENYTAVFNQFEHDFSDDWSWDYQVAESFVNGTADVNDVIATLTLNCPCGYSETHNIHANETEVNWDGVTPDCIDTMFSHLSIDYFAHNRTFSYYDYTVLVPPKGHSYDTSNLRWDWSFEPDIDYGNENCYGVHANVLFDCETCGNTMSVPAPVTRINYTAPSCTTAGYVKYSATAVYEGESFTDYHEKIVPMTGHNLIAIPAVEPTVNTNGNIAYWICSNCGKYFSDPNGENEITQEETVIPMIPFEDGIGAHLAGHSISLDGSIGVNFYMELSNEVIADSDAYMHFTIPKDGTPGEQIVYVKDAKTKTIGGKTYYLFQCNVAAKEIESDITAQMFSEGKSSMVYTYSVKEYADYLIEHQNDSAEFKNAVPLVQAMMTYGENARYYFDKTEDEPVNLDVTIPEYAGTIYEANLPEYVTYAGATLSLKSETTLSLYFNSDWDIVLTCADEGVTYETAHSGNEYVIRIRNIAAFDLNKTFTVKVDGVKAAEYSALAYCYKAQNSSNPKLVNTVKALYLYWLQADAYFKQN